MKTERNSIGVEIDEDYCRMALHRLKAEGRDLFREVEIDFSRMNDNGGNLSIQEEPEVYRAKKTKRPSKKKASKK